MSDAVAKAGAATVDGGVPDALGGRSPVRGDDGQPRRVHVLTGPAQSGQGSAMPSLRLARRTRTIRLRSTATIRGTGRSRMACSASGRAKAKSRAWQDGNLRLSDAPVGPILTRGRPLGPGALIDLGMFMEGAAVAARGQGLDTCPQAAFTHDHAIIRNEPRLPPEAMVICEMSPGRADMSVPANRPRTEGEPVSGPTTFHPDTIPNEEVH